MVEWSDLKMKRILLVIFVSLQLVFPATALAWSPLDSYLPVFYPGALCYEPVAGSEESNEETEEEEEPDCD